MAAERVVARQAASPDRRRPPAVGAATPAAVRTEEPRRAAVLQRLGNVGTAAALAGKPPASRPSEDQRVTTKAPSKPQAASLTVSSPKDSAEREATATAAKVMRLAAPAEAGPRVHAGGPEVRRRVSRLLQRAAGAAVSPNVTADIRRDMAGGRPLPGDVRTFMEPRFQASFGDVKVHTGERAAALNNQVSARAFTVGNHIFFGRNQYKPETSAGKELIAHELTHTIQQGAAVQRSAAPTVTARASTTVQRWGFGDVLDMIADKANIIPFFRVFTLVLGVNPINMSPVPRTAANILRALIELMPGGGLITQALESSGIFDKVGAWVETQVASLNLVGSAIKQSITAFIDSLHLSDIVHLDDVWERAKRIFTAPIDRIRNLAVGLVDGIITFVKDAILMPLAALAEQTRGWDLLIAVLGKNPITGAAVPRTAETLIPGFMKLIGQQEVWENMQKAKAIPRAWAWFRSAMATVLGFVEQIPTLAINAWKSLQLIDLVALPRAFAKVGAVFGNFIGNFTSWALNAVWNLLEIIFDVVSPGALTYIKKTGAALQSILKNPLPFVGNLVRAAKLGFQSFAANFGGHLKAGLIDWLTGSLPGVYIPKAFELGEIVKFVFSVLGLTWQNVRAKLVKAVGETAVKAMETGFDIVVTLVTQGPAAAWEKIKDQLAQLKDMVIGGITDFIVDMVVQKAVPKLIAMFIPGAGFISAILSIYDTVMVFVNKISTIMQVVTGFIDSIVAIAAGNVGGAAAKVESILAKLLTLAINFCAGFAGLGKVADKIMGVIGKVRGFVDQALDKLIAWIVTMAKKLFGAVKAGAKALVQWWKKQVPIKVPGDPHTLKFTGSEASAKLMVHSKPAPITQFVLDFLTAEGTKEQIKQAQGLDKQIDATQKKIAAAQAKNDQAEAEKLITQLDKQLGDLAKVLEDIITAGSDGDEGSAKHPLQVDYPKRRASAYPDIFVGPRVGEGIRIQQEWLRPLVGVANAKAKAKLLQLAPKLEKNAGFQAWDTAVRRLSPLAPQALDGGDPVGLEAQFAGLGPGKVLVYGEKEGTGGGHKINDRFKPFGFVPSSKGGEGMDGDHVLERQLGGPDSLANLWPLPRGENRSSGSKVKNLKVTLNAKTKPIEKTVHEARSKRKKSEPLHLLIRSVRSD